MIWRLYVDAKYCLLFQFRAPCISLDRLINYLLHARGLHALEPSGTASAAGSNLYANLKPAAHNPQTNKAHMSQTLSFCGWLRPQAFGIRKFEIQSPSASVYITQAGGHRPIEINQI